MVQEVRENMARFANGELSAAALEECLVANLQVVLDSNDEGAIAVVNELDTLFVRLSEGLVTENDIFDTVTAMIRAAQTERRPLPTPSLVTTSTGSAMYPGDNATQAECLVLVA